MTVLIQSYSNIKPEHLLLPFGWLGLGSTAVWTKKITWGVRGACTSVTTLSWAFLLLLAEESNFSSGAKQWDAVLMTLNTVILMSPCNHLNPTESGEGKGGWETAYSQFHYQ